MQYLSSWLEVPIGCSHSFLNPDKSLDLAGKSSNGNVMMACTGVPEEWSLLKVSRVYFSNPRKLVLGQEPLLKRSMTYLEKKKKELPL